MRSILIALALAAPLAPGASAQLVDVPADRMPDPGKTPGHATYQAATKVCAIRSTMDARNAPDPAKKEVYDSHGSARCQTQCIGPQGCEIDRSVNLERGDATTTDNAWPQPYDGDLNAQDKDRLENKVHRRPGRVTLSR